MEWSKKDPRDVYSHTRQSIVILMPNLKGDPIPYMGYIDTKQEWIVLTSNPEHGVIASESTWPPEWAWISAP